jgi:lipoprotein-anchoring transpeptidase ErfK/SrfK
MPDDRPRPVRLNLAPRRKPRSGAAKTRGKGNRPRRPAGDDSTLLYWIAAVLVLILAGLIVVCIEMPRIKAYLNPSKTPPPGEKHQPAPGAHADEEIQAQRLAHRKAQEEAEARRRAKEQLARAAAAAVPAPPAPRVTAPVLLPPPPANPPALVPPPGFAPEASAPLVQSVPITPHGAPARALPLDPNKLDTERIAAYQVALERMHFSCGFIDGDQGMRTQRMLRAFQQSRGLPLSGFLDPATRAAIGEPGEPFLSYVVTAQDMASIMPKPSTWREKAQAKRLGYNTIWELLAEKFHCTRAYLKALNRDVPEPVAGSEIIGPKVFPAAPIPQAASLRVNLAETSIEALDASGRIIAFFPCSIAKDKAKRPNGKLVVKSVVPDPDYTFDPALFADAAKAEGLTHKMVLPPGPRNPVGTAWIGLSLPGYGIHGTPEPENISRTQSHGCFRLANWNAEKVLRMVRVGTPVDVEP